jgi:O-antigen/teichoic acid export membrane protein
MPEIHATSSHDYTHDLRRKTIRGATAAGGAQAAAFVLRLGSMVIMARLLYPEDFGLVGMVTAVTGFMAFFHDFGLSVASVQRVSVTEEQMSTLFWINVGAGTALAGLCILLAPLLVRFYGESRLLPISAVLGTGFLFNASAVQHRAILQRSMRFGVLAVVDSVSLVVGISAGIGLAIRGAGYWALVIMTIAPTVVGAGGMWLTTRWRPGRPKRRTGVRSMLIFGGTVTLNNLLVYFAYNADKMLLGRFWGADVLGLYGRAYQLINIPTDNLNSTISQVALPALARLQKDPQRLRDYFLQGYGLFVATVIPITVACGLFSEDIVQLFLGARWRDAAPIFRLLAPTILVFAFVNPLGWLMIATGYARRSLWIAVVLAPTVIIGYSLGLPWGARGVAVGFSAAMMTLVVPIITWAKHDTLITFRNILSELIPPLAAILAAAFVNLPLQMQTGHFNNVLVRLTLESLVLFIVYGVILLFAFGRFRTYSKVLADLRLRPSRRAQVAAQDEKAQEV